jgi:AbrB family looped-hinge helix DNA binding protein
MRQEREYISMVTDETPEETKVSDRGMVTVPATLRRRLDIGPGDTLRWSVEDEGTLTVEVRKQRHGAFDDFEPASMGSDGLDTHDSAGYETDISVTEER